MNSASVVTPLMRRICILTGNHLCHNPRVIKEAEALSSAGHDVTILGGFYDDELKRRDLLLLEKSRYRFIPVIDWTSGGLAKSLPLTISRMGKLLYRTLKIENNWQLGSAYPFLKRAAFLADADLYICHMEQALAVGTALHRNGKRVAVDMEDWYSEDIPPHERRRRSSRLLRDMEKYLLSNGEFGVCTSHSMAGSLTATYGCNRPHVVYNTFPWADRMTIDHQAKDRRVTTRPSLYWFSQTIGPARGLEDLMNALPSVTQDVEIHLRGMPSQGYKDWLESHTPDNWKNRIFLHDMVHNTEILSRIVEHDIGFAGEQPDCRSRNVTISNKLFHYMLGGLAVIASDTAGQVEIAKEVPGAIHLYGAGDPLSLASRINELVASPDALKAAKMASLRAAAEKYNWEMEKSNLLNLVTQSPDRIGHMDHSH
jgi:glycosyltransferase involved in cell wall biosynthesis